MDSKSPTALIAAAHALTGLQEHPRCLQDTGQTTRPRASHGAKAERRCPSPGKQQHHLADKYDTDIIQPLGDIFHANVQKKASPAQLSLKANLQKNVAKTKFHIAEDAENAASTHTPTVLSPVNRALFAKQLAKDKENHNSNFYAPATEEEVSISPTPCSPQQYTQSTVFESQQDTQTFTQESPQSTQPTQPTQPTQSIRHSIQLSQDERRDTGESFVSAKEAFGSKRASNEDARDAVDHDAMELDGEASDAPQSSMQDTVIHHVIHHKAISYDEPATANHDKVMQSPAQPRFVSEAYSVSAETHDALDIANHRAHAPEPENLLPLFPQPPVQSETSIQYDDTIVRHHIDDQMDVDDEEVRSPSETSSPVKPLVRKSSLTFAALPAREPLLAKKSMGNRVSRTSHVDQSKARNSQMGRFTGGKSLGGSQHTHKADLQDDAMDVDSERPVLVREESQTTKLHNSNSTKSLLERLNKMKQRHEVTLKSSQNVGPTFAPQPPTIAAWQQSPPTTAAWQQPQSPQPVEPVQPVQPAYPQLSFGTIDQVDMDEGEDDEDWISPIRQAETTHTAVRPPMSKSHSADARPSPSKAVVFPKPISVSNPDLSTVVESTTPAGSPTGKRNMDGPISASKAKLYSAFRAAKEKIIGSSAASAQAKLDALAEGPVRPKLQPTTSSEDVFTSPKRSEKAGNGLFSGLRSPSKETLRSAKTAASAMPASPTKSYSRRTRSSFERERQKEKEVKEKLRTEDRLREMREKEQSKAAAQYQKTKTTGRTPGPVPPPAHAKPTPAAYKMPVLTVKPRQSRQAVTKMNTAARHQDQDAVDDLPPPPPPKSLLPTGNGHQTLRPPKKLAKPASKENLPPKVKPQSIRVNLHPFGQAPKASSKAVQATAPRAGSQAVQPAPPAPKPTLAPVAKPVSAPRTAPSSSKAPTRTARPQPPKAIISEKSKPAPTQRADLGAARPPARIHTVQDANRINIPPVNPAKPAKRPFQPETNDETIHRPAKRPSQQAQAKYKPVTPAHTQFASGKIPFAEPSQPAEPTINPEDITLPEIHTDSEDDDDDDFVPPSWTKTPRLHELLIRQQLIDPETIFGPIPPVNLEELFPDKPERFAKFRERTSSGFWEHDKVTTAEKKKAREAQERLVRNGGWTFNPTPTQTPVPETRKK